MPQRGKKSRSPSLITRHPLLFFTHHPSPVFSPPLTPYHSLLTTHFSLLTHHPLPITCILFIGSKQLTPSPGAIMRPYQFTRLFHAFTSPQSPARFPISPFLPRLNESTTQRLNNLLNASTIHPSPLTIYHSLLTTHYSLLTHHPLPITLRPSPITHYPLLFARHPSPITHHKK